MGTMDMKHSGGMRGLFVAAVTPYTADNRMNLDAFDALIDRTLGQGAAGYLIAGSSAECFMLSREERVALFFRAAEHAARAPMIANVSAIGLDEALHYAEQAERAGMDAIMSTAPFYFKHDQAAIARYFRDIHAACGLPLYLYNFPVNTGVNIDIYHPEIAEILTDGTLAGIKQTSIDLGQLERMGAINPSLRLFAGYDDVYLGALALGAHGAIGSSYNVSLPLFTKIEGAFSRGDMAEALACQRRANGFLAVINRCGLFPSIKYILCRTGVEAGVCRRPFAPLGDEQRRMLDAAIEEYLGPA